MNRATRPLCLLVGLSVLFLSACNNEVHLALALDHSIVVNPKYKDHLMWKDVKVHFLVNPCKETDPWLSECTINVKLQPGEFGQYNYKCQGGLCTDPEVDVGSSTGVRPTDKLSLRDPAADVQVALPCNSGTIQPAPPAVPGDFYPAIKPGQVVQWLSNGGPGVWLTDWTVTFVDGGGNPITASVCTTSDIHDADGYRTCTLKSTGTYTYKAASTKCATGGSGTVIVTP